MTVAKMATITVIVVLILLVSAALFVTMVELDFTTTAPGRIEPRRMVDVALARDGRVVHMARLGPVKEGEVLVELDGSAEKQRCAFIADKLALLEKETEKEKPPLGSYQRHFGLVSQVKDLRMELAELERTIEEKQARSPFAGVVLETIAAEGSLVSAGSPVLVLADTSGFIFRASVGPHVRRDLTEAVEARMRLDSYPHMKYGEGRMQLAGIETRLRSGEPAAYDLAFVITEAPDYELKPGLAGTAEIITFRGTTVQYMLRDGDASGATR